MRQGDQLMVESDPGKRYWATKVEVSLKRRKWT